jgi:hypothetical protein
MRRSAGVLVQLGRAAQRDGQQLSSSSISAFLSPATAAGTGQAAAFSAASARNVGFWLQRSSFGGKGCANQVIVAGRV